MNPRSLPKLTTAAVALAAIALLSIPQRAPLHAQPAGGMPPTFDVETRIRVAQHHAQVGRFAQARLPLEQAATTDAANQTVRDLLAKIDAVAK